MNCGRKEKFGEVLGFSFLVAKSKNEEQRAKNNSGVTLIGIIVAIVIMGLLSAGVLMLVATGSMESIQTLKWGEAFFAAESGVSAARAYIATGAATGEIAGTVGQASFTATVDAEGRIVSVGVSDEAQWTSIYGGGAKKMPAVIVYREGSECDPRYRTYDDSGRVSEEFTAQPVLWHALRWQRVEASPRTNVFLLAVQDGGPDIWVQAYTFTNQISNGTWFANMQVDAEGPPENNMRGFDLAYEKVSGRGMVVYSVGTETLQYRIWSANAWSPPQPVPLGANGPVYWVRLVSRPGQNEIMCLARWRQGNNYSGAIVWNGASWSSNTVSLESNCVSEINYQTFDAAYSANAAMVVYINGANAAERLKPKYKIYNATSMTWSAEASMDSLGGNGDNNQPKWIRVEYSPDGTMAYAAFILKVSARFRGTYWNGSAWGEYNKFNNVSLYSGQERAFDIAWSSRANTLMVVYSLNQTALSYMLTSGAGSTTNFGDLVATDKVRWCVLKPDPCSADFYCLTLDNKKDVSFQRWTGAAWTTNNLLRLEASSDTSYSTIDFSFRPESAAEP